MPTTPKAPHLHHSPPKPNTNERTPPSITPLFLTWGSRWYFPGTCRRRRGSRGDRRRCWIAARGEIETRRSIRRRGRRHCRTRRAVRRPSHRGRKHHCAAHVSRSRHNRRHSLLKPTTDEAGVDAGAGTGVGESCGPLLLLLLLPPPLERRRGRFASATLRSKECPLPPVF